MSTRHDFLKGLTALSDGYIAARFAALEIGEDAFVSEPWGVVNISLRSSGFAAIMGG